jgi:hypothetical protein
LNADAMKRTLLAVGVAVLISMMLIPRGVVTVEHYGHVQEGDIQEFLPFFLHSQQQYKIMWHTFMLETIFLVILAAVIVNFPSRRKRERD